jgi:hypothetical protein
MDQPTGQGNAAIFAAEGSARHRLVRAAIAAGAALLAAWLIALALGVMGGFGSLPGLPSSHPRGSNEASSRTQAPPKPAAFQTRQVTPVMKPAAPARGGSSISQSHSSAPKKTTVVQSPSTSAVVTPTTRGHATTKTTGKPVGTPGNGPDSAPGQLR